MTRTSTKKKVFWIVILVFLNIALPFLCIIVNGFVLAYSFNLSDTDALSSGLFLFILITANVLVIGLVIGICFLIFWKYIRPERAKLNNGFENVPFDD